MSALHRFLFTRFAEKKFLRLENEAQTRIRAKLEEIRNHQRIESVLKPLTNFGEATHRLRVGDYRVVYAVDEKEKTITVYRVRHRKDVYR